MTQQEILNKLAEKAGVTKTQAKECFDQLFAIFSDELEKGEKVRVHNFGTFSVTKRQARKGRNPQTGQEITIPAQKVVKFNPSTTLKKQVDK